MQFKKEYNNLPKTEKDRIIKQYKIEVRYAAILKRTPNPARARLYKKLYDDFYRRLPENPLKIRAKKKGYIKNKTQRQTKLLLPFLTKSTNVIEIGSGDFSLTIGLSTYVNYIMGVDVSDENISKNQIIPDNVEIFIAKHSTSMPNKKNVFHLAYSNQLLEHFHPKDLKIHLSNIYSLLRITGKYVFQTPHKYFGPHDVTKYFHDRPRGFHLKEYNNFELFLILNKAGFRKVKLLTGLKGYRIHLPIQFSIIIELFLLLFPYQIRKDLSLLTPFRKFINGHIIATK
tara:strand:+ start:1760 stop:2617 length:858 start_codon:yes stop_codon:yes gene_type:complete